jgi:NADH dehydrogenase
MSALGDIANAPDPAGYRRRHGAGRGRSRAASRRALARHVRDGRPIHCSNSTTAATPRSSAATPRCSISLDAAQGRFAWLMWASSIYLLVGFDNRLRVTLQWLWAYHSSAARG